MLENIFNVNSPWNAVGAKWRLGKVKRLISECLNYFHSSSIYSMSFCTFSQSEYALQFGRTLLNFSTHHTQHRVRLHAKTSECFSSWEFGKHEGSREAASEIFIHSTRLRSHALIIVAQQIIPRRLENQSRAEGKKYVCAEKHDSTRRG